MPTLNEMIDEVKSKLIGYTMNQDKVTYVNNSSGITAVDTTIELGASNNFAKGIIEIDDELIWVESYNKTTGTLNVVPNFGRGYLGTNPAPHSRYAQITLSPSFPRVNIKQAINDTINAVGDRIYAIESTTFTYNSATTTYALPDDVHDVLSVTWESVGPSKEWIPVRRWRQDRMASAASFNSTQTISIYDLITSGRNVLVWYTTPPNTLDNGDEDFTNITGLPETSKDVIILGACYRLLSFLDAGRINVTSAEADLNDSKIPSSAGGTVSRYVYALFQSRLSEEVSRLQTNYPTRIHYSR
jgi:hypothetical protein